MHLKESAGQKSVCIKRSGVCDEAAFVLVCVLLEAHHWGTRAAASNSGRAICLAVAGLAAAEAGTA